MKNHKGLWIRGDQIYLRFTNAHGKRMRPPSGFPVGQEKEALELLATIKRQVEAEQELLAAAETGGDLPSEGVTVRALGGHWNSKRLKKEETLQAATEDTWKLEYIYKFLGHILVTEFRTKHGHEFVEWLEGQKGRRGKLGARTVRSIWSCLHNLFRFAVGKEFIPVNPCVPAGVGETGHLPEIEDKDEEWRDTAVFERYEVERLISDERLPEWHRVLWAIKFLSGMRDSEAYALRISRYEPRIEPLGRLTVAKGWNTRHQKLKKPKTKKRRKVPVHPTLAKVLAEWLLSGWEAHVGRKPKPDDLLIPNEEGGYLRVDSMLGWFRDDLTALGLRADRQQYDTRRTYKSLSEDDGASPEKIRWVMWGRRGTVEDGYSSHAWAAFCTEVAKLRIDLLEGRIVQMTAFGGEKGTPKGTTEFKTGETSMISEAGTRIRTGDLLITNAYRGHNPTQRVTSIRSVSGGMVSDSPRLATPHPTPPVPLCLSGRSPRPDIIRLALQDALRNWEAGSDPQSLRRDLTAILGAIPEGAR